MKLTELRGMIYPESLTCLGCECALDDGQLCPECSDALTAQRLTGCLCPACGEPLSAKGGCRLCRFGWQLHARSTWSHRALARDLVHRLKFGRVRETAAVLADGMQDTAHSLLRNRQAVVSWIPMPPSRRRTRIYDHAELLAEQLALRLGLPLTQTLTRIERGKMIQHQVGANVMQRITNLQGTFAATPQAKGVILLVDDVLTTGATTALASQCLLEAGAEQVLVLTATRADGKDQRSTGGSDHV